MNATELLKNKNNKKTGRTAGAEFIELNHEYTSRPRARTAGSSWKLRKRIAGVALRYTESAWLVPTRQCNTASERECASRVPLDFTDVTLKVTV